MGKHIKKVDKKYKTLDDIQVKEYSGYIRKSSDFIGTVFNLLEGNAKPESFNDYDGIGSEHAFASHSKKDDLIKALNREYRLLDWTLEQESEGLRHYNSQSYLDSITKIKPVLRMQKYT